MVNTYQVPERVREGSVQPITTMDAYGAEYARWQSDPDGFWLAETTQSIAWQIPPNQGLNGGYDTIAERPFSWFADGTLNVTVSCLDRHAESQPDKTAIIWEGDEPGDVRRISYRELLAEVSKTANALKDLGVGSGDRVIIYMGMVPEAAMAMLRTPGAPENLREFDRNRRHRG